MTNEARMRLLKWWVLWIAFQTGIVMIYYFLSKPIGAPIGEFPEELLPPRPDSPFWLAGVVPVAISCVIRWIVLPTIRNGDAALILFLVGLGMAEATCFLGLFLFPIHQQELFILSFLGIFQFMPFFARRYYVGEGNPKDESF